MNNWSVVLYCCLAAVCVCGHQGCAAEESNVETATFKTAMNPSESLQDRIDAALQLSDFEKAKLRSQLLVELPGGWDASALDAIRILGEVGDLETIGRLEEIADMPDETTGMFTPVIRRAIEKIRHRLKAGAAGAG